MTAKFTAIASYPNPCGAVRMLRLEQNDGETVADMLTRAGIDKTCQWLFQGHPLLCGETKEEE